MIKKCAACGSTNLEDAFKAMMVKPEKKTFVNWLVITVKAEQREYDLIECLDCGFTALYRDRKESLEQRQAEEAYARLDQAEAPT